MHTRKKLLAAVLGAAAIGASVIGLSVSSASSGGQDPAATYATTTPIKHVVVIFGENISFDHYFGTYPTALNPPGEPQFHAAPNTPTVNGLNAALLAANPNLNNPQRLDPSQALTCDQNHGYSAEQSAFDMGLMDKFVQDTTGSGCTQSTFPNSGSYGPNGIVMDYYDGNTVTALWNYAQHYTLNDNSYSTQFGPSTPGAINLISGNTNGAVAHGGTSSNIANGTLFGDAEPLYDQCSNSSHAAQPRRHARRGHGFVPQRRQRRRSAEPQEHHLGLVPGRVHAIGDHQRPRDLRHQPDATTSVSTPTSGTRTRPITRSTTSRSSTTPIPRTPTTCRRPRSPMSASATRRTRRPRRRSTTSTTCRGSTRR